MPSQRLKGLANGKLGGPEKPLMCGLGSKIGLTVESEEGEVPHLRWSQAPPLPWPRPGSADIYVAAMYFAMYASALRLDS